MFTYWPVQGQLGSHPGEGLCSLQPQVSPGLAENSPSAVMGMPDCNPEHSAAHTGKYEDTLKDPWLQAFGVAVHHLRSLYRSL